MKVNKLIPCGYCHGVVNAITLLNKLVEDVNVERPIYVLGMLIHNKNVIDDFTKKGVITLEDKSKTRLELLDEINSGTVVITAHGASPLVLKKANDKGLNVVDATCKDVTKVHDNIIKKLNANFTILYIGKKGHPETEGVLGISDNINLICNEEDIDKLNLDHIKTIYITNQTTLSKYDLDKIHTKLKNTYENIEFDNEICNATTMRQDAVIKQPYADLCIVVGDTKSSNTNKLKEVSINIANVKTIQVETVKDLDKIDLSDINSINITSGASTPTYITNEVINHLKNI